MGCFSGDLRCLNICFGCAQRDAGTEGDTVNVLNVESKRTVQGVVTGLGRVTVSTAPSRFAKADDARR